MIPYESGITLLTMARPKGRRGSCLGTSLGMSLGREKRISFTPAVATRTDGKGRRDHEAGNDESRMVMGQEVVLGMQEVTVQRAVRLRDD